MFYRNKSLIPHDNQHFGKHVLLNLSKKLI